MGGLYFVTYSPGKYSGLCKRMAYSWALPNVTTSPSDINDALVSNNPSGDLSQASFFKEVFLEIVPGRRTDD